jgi:transposase, IS30 family
MEHLTRSQRDQIAVLIKTDTTQGDIARLVGCSQSTISREIVRGKSPLYLCYSGEKAQEKADRRRTVSYEKRDQWYDDPRVLRYVVEELKKRKSPEQIAGRMKRLSPWHKTHAMSVRSIYT